MPKTTTRKRTQNNAKGSNHETIATQQAKHITKKHNNTNKQKSEAT